MSQESNNNKNSIDILDSLSNAIISLTEKVSPSVIGVRSKNYHGGSGIVWDSQGIILTCNHILSNQSEGMIVSSEKTGNMESMLVARDPYSDIALLKVARKDLVPIEQSGVKDLKTGQIIFALANPAGATPGITQGVITTTMTSFKGRGFSRGEFIVTDARLKPGYSGGPLVDAGGNMIGMNMYYMASRGIAQRIDHIRSVVNNLLTHGKIKRAYLGIVSYPISLPSEITKQENNSSDGGLMILSVQPDSPAKKAGLLIGDVIIKLDSQTVKTLADLYTILNNESIIGKGIKISVIRGEKITQLDIVPTEVLN